MITIYTERKNNEQATFFGNDLRTDEEVEIISVSPALFSRAFQFYSDRMDKEWGFTDCISFVVMKDRKLTEALTADHHFVQAGFKALLRDDPI